MTESEIRTEGTFEGHFHQNRSGILARPKLGEDSSMSRYFNTGDSRPNDSRSSARIVLPEFIPFNDDCGNDQNEKMSLPPPPNRQETRSRRNSDRSSERSSDSRFSDRRMNHENGQSKTSPRGAYRSPQKAEVRRSSPQRRNRGSPQRVHINRHNSPQRPKRISPPRSHTSQKSSSRNRSRSPRNEVPYDRGEDHAGLQRDQRSNEQRHGSVFDRMSSPPPHPVRRRFRDTLSRENSRVPSPQIYRIIDPNIPANSRYEQQLESEESRLNNNPNFSRYQRDSPFDYSKRYAMGPEEIRGIDQAAGLSRLREESLEMREMRERLIAAESHCHGLETTVLSYHREIVKLRTIVNAIISDFEVIQNIR